MTPTARRALASAAIHFVLAYTGRLAVGRQASEEPFIFTLGEGFEDLEDAVLTVVGVRRLILSNPSVVKGDGGSACFSH